MAGVYVSWPFCAQKCTYCNFASGVQPKELEAQYATALIAEIRAHQWAWRPETVYLGGGTPSSLPGPDLAAILAGIPGAPWREATIETAPGSVTVEKVRAWRTAGINRVSLGVQSFVKPELARTGRRHDAETVQREVALLRDEGIENFNIDLIAGLPGQTMSSWDESLRRLLDLDPPHVSVYMLEVDEDSRLGSEIILGGKRYGASDTPSDEAIASFYETAVARLASHGIHRYEISNFAKPELESIHNLKYWRREPYIGFGSDAHSFDGDFRWRNREEARDYVVSWRDGQKEEANSDEERFLVGLRLTEGVLLTESDLQRWSTVIDRFTLDGAMELLGNRLRLTPRGIMVSNEVIQEFLS